METLVLPEMQWDSPFKLYQAAPGRQIDDIHPKLAGVYLWTVPIGDRYYPHYVGETGNLQGWLSGHRANLMGGGYWVYDPVELSQGRLTPIYNPNREYRTFDAVADRAKAFTLLLSFFILPFPADEQLNTKRVRLRTELGLARSIEAYYRAQPDGPQVWDMTCGPQHERNKQKDGEPRVHVQTQVPACLVGVPARVDAG